MTAVLISSHEGFFECWAYHSVPDQLCNSWRLIYSISNDVVYRQRRNFILLARSLLSALLLDSPNIRKFPILVLGLRGYGIMDDDVLRTGNSTKLSLEIFSSRKPIDEASIANCLEENGVVV